jgi:hypothetical protein
MLHPTFVTDSFPTLPPTFTTISSLPLRHRVGSGAIVPH